MKHTKITVISMMSLLMVACGGGGGGESSTSSPTPAPIAPVVETPAVETPAVETPAVETPVVETPVVETPVVEIPVVETPVEEIDPDALYETTAELVVAKSFLIEPEFDLAVSFKNEDNRSAYLSVCTEFTEGQDGISVNYNSCLLRTSIDSDYDGTLKVANDKNRLVMAIWYLDDAQNPSYEIWENDMNEDNVRTFEVN